MDNDTKIVNDMIKELNDKRKETHMFNVNRDFGSITNLEGVTKDINVNIPKTFTKRGVITGVILGVGGFLGALWFDKCHQTAFYEGANAFMNAEYDTMKDLGLFKD